MKSLHRSLTENGYTFQDWIGAEETDAFFAINPHGNTVVITVTKPQPRYKSEDHHFLISTKDTVKHETYQEALALFADLTGICLITEDGMCLVENDSVINYAHNYENPSAKCTKHMKHPLRYPVIAYSEIMSSPKAILENTDMIHHKLSDSATRSITQNMEDFHESLNKLNSAAKDTFSQTHRSLRYLLETTDEDRSKIITAAKTTPGSEEHSKLQGIIVQKEESITSIADVYSQIQIDIAKLNKMASRIQGNLNRLEINN